MAEGAIKLKKIKSVTANGVTDENVLDVREEHLMNITPQFVPNTYQGLGVLEKAKWRQITIIFDSDSDALDASYSVTAANSSIGTSFIIKYTVADAAGTEESWTYEHGKSYVMGKEPGRIEDGAARNTTEYTVLTYGTRTIS